MYDTLPTHIRGECGYIWCKIHLPYLPYFIISLAYFFEFFFNCQKWWNNQIVWQMPFCLWKVFFSTFKGLSLTSLQKRLAKQNKYCCCYPYFKKKPEKNVYLVKWKQRSLFHRRMRLTGLLFISLSLFFPCQSPSATHSINQCKLL